MKHAMALLHQVGHFHCCTFLLLLGGCNLPLDFFVQVLAWHSVLEHFLHARQVGVVHGSLKELLFLRVLHDSHRICVFFSGPHTTYNQCRQIWQRAMHLLVVVDPTPGVIQRILPLGWKFDTHTMAGCARSSVVQLGPGQCFIPGIEHSSAYIWKCLALAVGVYSTMGHQNVVRAPRISISRHWI